MKSCTEYQEQFIEAYYNELSERDKNEIMSHVTACKECSDEYKKMETTLAVMSKRTRKEPTEQYWQQYWNTLSASLEKETVREPAPVRFSSLPAWAYGIAAMLLIGIGLFFGKILYSPETHPVQESITNNQAQTKANTQQEVQQQTQENATGSTQEEPSPSIAQNVAPAEKESRPVKTPSGNGNIVQTRTENEARSYLNRSKIMLLGLINTDEEDESFSLSQQQSVSRSLLKEAADLKPKLIEPDQQRVKQLIEELEVILLQLANIEEQTDLPAVQLVKKGVDQKAILLKINLEEMRTMKHKKTTKKSTPNDKTRM